MSQTTTEPFFLLLLFDGPSFNGTLDDFSTTTVAKDIYWHSRFHTFAVLWMLYSFFWVIPRRLNFMFRRFRTNSQTPGDHPKRRSTTNKNMRKKHSQWAFIHYATLFGHWICFWRPEIRKGYVAIDWNYCAGHVFTARQTDGNLINIAQYCPQTV